MSTSRDIDPNVYLAPGPQEARAAPGPGPTRRRETQPLATRLAESLRPRGPFYLELSEEKEGERTLIRARGEIDVVTAPKLASRLDTILRSGSAEIVIDLSDTEFLDSAGLHVLLNAQRRLTRRARVLRVLCAAGPVRHVIELARLVETLNVTDPE